MNIAWSRDVDEILGTHTPHFRAQRDRKIRVELETAGPRAGGFVVHGTADE